MSPAEGLRRLRAVARSSAVEALCLRHGIRVLLMEMTDANVDLVVLNGAGSLIRERALVEADPLYESADGAWASAATTAATERMDTDWIRQLNLRLLAEQ